MKISRHLSAISLAILRFAFFRPLLAKFGSFEWGDIDRIKKLPGNFPYVSGFLRLDFIKAIILYVSTIVSEKAKLVRARCQVFRNKTFGVQDVDQVSQFFRFAI